MKNEYSVLLVEDDILCRHRLTNAIQGQPHLTLLDDIGSIREAMKVIETTNLDVLIVDIGLPDGNGIDLIRHCKTLPNHIICLVVTIHGDEHHVLDALAAGATGYLLKDAPLSDLGEAIISAIGGDTPISPRVAKALLSHLRPPTTVIPVDVNKQLTSREIDVLEHLARGYTRAEVAETLFISIHTVSIHIKHIYEKLHVHSGKEAVHKARQHGILRDT